jgi:hypothetical protein
VTGHDEPPQRLDFPHNWDVLRDEAPEGAADGAEPVAEGTPRSTPSTLTLFAASWGDAVSALTVCTAALVGVAAGNHEVGVTALPWAAAVGVAWWLATATVVIVVRQGTPGMLLAGVAFADRVPPRRLGPVLAVAAVHAALLGLPGVLGARRSPLALAAGSPIRLAGA